MRFGSRGASEDVMFPVRSPRIRPRVKLTERDWENAVEGIGNEMLIFAHLNSYSLQRTKLLGTPIHMRVLPGGKRKGEGGGGGGGGRGGQGKGKGILMGQLIGEQCNSPLIQSTLHSPLRQSKLFAPFLCTYFKQFCALILLRKELI